MLKSCFSTADPFLSGAPRKAASALLVAGSARRALKLLPIPLGLSGLGLLAGGYYANKAYRSVVGY